MSRREMALLCVGIWMAPNVTACREVLDGPRVLDAVPHVFWRVPSLPSANPTPYEPAANDDKSMLYFLGSDFRLRKIRAADGTVVWDVDAGPVLQAFPNMNVVVSGGSVIVPKVDLFAFDTTTGEPKWTYVAPDGDAAGYSAIVGDDSTVFAASWGARLLAIEAGTGTPRWIADLTGGESDIGALFPVLAGGTVYVCTRSVGASLHGTLWAVDARTGVVRWSFPFQPELPEQYAACYGDPAIWHDLVIQPQSDGRVFAFEAATGIVRWIAPRVHQLPSQTPSGGWVGSWVDPRWAAAYGDHLVVTSKVGRGMLVGYDPATGVERWRNEDIAGVHLSHPKLDAETVYLGYGYIYAAFDLATGQLKWRTPATDLGPPTMLQGKPIIGTDRLYIAGRDGSYATRK
jgi:outer membrane protein assembly factor BamB